MQIKGCSRRVISLREPKSKYFDAIYFVLKPGLPKSCERDMLREAELIISGGTTGEKESAPEKPKRPEADGVLAYFSGAATVGAAVGAIALAAHLIF